MGFNKCFIDTKPELEKFLAERGVDALLSRYRKCDAMIGDSDGIEFLKQLFIENNLYGYKSEKESSDEK